MGEFRKFTDQAEFSGEPAAKLYKHGDMRFNKAAGDRWFRDVDYVEIFVDQSGTEIGFKPAPETREGTYKYRRDSDSDSGNVAVRSVLSNYGIWHERMDESIALPIRYDESEEMPVVDIAEAVERWGHTANIE